ncbi:MAG TPA: GMC oxidoreductase [Actinophytocola sp.]|jgi:choline dehydrogenase|uniref:GMC family oxidoreductase n=1 Tax=Actinophytocola sp. TaxID=1872138 RepID=UPI002DFB3AE9|nr:GMC oxidoreductase [Actinophytocola sp.]
MGFDHIIVGAGSAGCVLAARLSEDPARTVLLLEAGPDWPDPALLPADLANALTVSVADHDWGYDAEVVPGRRLPYARGKVTGGCSAVNGAIALRGVPGDYDEWAALGNDEWGWRRVLPYLRGIEDDQDADGPSHARGGPVPIVRWTERELVPFQRAYLEACLDQGFRYVSDHNDPSSTGVGPIPMNRRGGRRVSAADAYLAAARTRANLTIRPGCLVHRVLFDGVRAIGVEVESRGRLERIHGDQISLSAGAINTPALLLRSGVGAPDPLRALDIDVVLDAPNVGANLIEHQQIAVGLVPKPGVTDPNDPDVQVLVRYTAPGTARFNNMQLYFVSRYVPATHRPISVMSVLQKPDCRGQVSLTTADPHAQPSVVLNSYGTAEDQRIALDGLRLCWDIANSAPVRALSKGTVDTLTARQVDDDDALLDYLREHSATIWHPVGTCRMGPSHDPFAVVDQYLRVHGTENLTVVDASVMPTHVSANPNLTCYVIGERAAAWLAGDRMARTVPAGRETVGR